MQRRRVPRVRRSHVLWRPVVSVDRGMQVAVRPVRLDVLVVQAVNAGRCPRRHVVGGLRVKSYCPLVVSTERVTIRPLIVMRHVLEFGRLATVGHVLGGHLHDVLIVVRQVV